MSEKTIESYGKGFLVLLLPISFVVVFVVSTWRIWLGLILLMTGINLWQRYQWDKWCEGVNPVFHQLIQQNQGSVTPMDLAIRGNFSGDKAKRFLDTKASEFGASVLNTNDGKQVYYFMTANILGSIFDSSEPVKTEPRKSSTTAMPLLAAPTTMPLVIEEKPELVAAETLTAKPQVKEAELQQAEVLQTDNNQTEVQQAQVKHILSQEDELLQAEVKEPQQVHEATTLAQQLVFGSLIQSELAKRLSVYSSTVFKRRDDPDFPEWSRNRDPDGIAWRYDRKAREFFPIEK
ncbi:hypothetical protein NIES4071_59980 [Calothrix sp. NIES-4071]|nr:hypothetical protein NIES4071_59980 [Calothrix sp. NIES-4071]BAZ60305.1 hypothetical protein NIES4105_59930 [Calothrix sp. NIES-4105]